MIWELKVVPKEALLVCWLHKNVKEKEEMVYIAKRRGIVVKETGCFHQGQFGTKNKEERSSQSVGDKFWM